MHIRGAIAISLGLTLGLLAASINAAGAVDDLTFERASATGLFSDLVVAGLVPLNVARNPDVILPHAGGDVTDQVVLLNIPSTNPAITATVLRGHADGVEALVGPVHATADVATLDVNPLNLHLTAVSSECRVGPGEITGSSSLVGRVGLAPLLSNAPPNTTIPLPGVGSLVLNEQVRTISPQGEAITVSALHIIGGAPSQGELVVARSHCDPSAPENPDIPEIGHVILLPLTAVVLMAGLVFYRRRRKVEA